QEIRKLLQESLTPEFFKSVKSACDAVSRLLNDPAINQDIKSILSRLNELLKTAQEEGFIEKAVALMSELQKKLSELDMESCNKILAGLGDLIEQINNAHFIEHIVNALKAAKSVGDFFELAKTFMGEHSHILLTYGPYAAIVGLALSKILNHKAANQSDSQMQKYLQEINENLRVLTFTNIHFLRQTMLDNYRKISLDLNVNKYDFDPMLRQRMIQEKEYACKFINTVPMMKQESILALAPIEKKLEKLIEKFASQEINNQSLEEFLDYIGMGYQQYWFQLLNYTIYSQQIAVFSSQVKPQVSRHEFNFDGICRLYGTQSVRGLMQKLANEFFSHGGGRLYYELANSLHDSAGLFLAITQLVSQNEEPVDIAIPEFVAPALELQRFYHDSAQEFIQQEWKKITWPIGYEHQEYHLNDRMIQIIRARAFAEYVQKNAGYFFGLYPIPREIFNSILDIPRGLYQIIRHPIDTIQGLGNLLTLDGWRCVGHSLYYHPVRMLAPSVLAGASNYALTASSSSSKLTHLKNLADLNKFKAGTAVISAPACSATTLTTATSVTATTLTMPKILSAKGDIEMTTPHTTLHTAPHSLQTTPAIDWDNLWNYVIYQESKQDSEVDVYHMIQAWYQETQGQKPSRKMSERFFQPAAENEEKLRLSPRK
ncbi:MAG: hypothetical protein EBY16_08325, partial [Gammaproteobacteria bacterium]|nr:hypothetical protein [Gammaproteobacteria bacterium]